MSEIEVNDWIVRLLSLHGVRLHRMGPGEIGLMDVPRKWSGVIGDLAQAVQILAAGKPLPTFRCRAKCDWNDETPCVCRRCGRTGGEGITARSVPLDPSAPSASQPAPRPRRSDR